MSEIYRLPEEFPPPGVLWDVSFLDEAREAFREHRYMDEDIDSSNEHLWEKLQLDDDAFKEDY